MDETLSFRSWSKKFHGFPFQTIYLGKKRTKICVLSAPLYLEQYDVFRKMKQDNYFMVGISSYGFFPFVNESDCIHNDRASSLKTEEVQTMLKQIDCWLICSKEPVPYDVPQLMFSESDCHVSPHTLTPNGLVKKYDVIYNAGSDCEFHQYHKNWKLAKACFQKMSDAGLSILVIGRNAPDDFDLPNVTYKQYLKWHEFMDAIEESRVLFVPNVSDASPRILTESLCKGTPILVNNQIFGGWKYVNDCTGAFFESEDDVMQQFHYILNASPDPRKWFSDNYFPNGESKKLAELKEFIASICGGTIPMVEDPNAEEMEYSYTFSLPAIEMHDIQFLYVSVDTEDDFPLCRHDLREHVDKFTVTFKTRLIPHHWVFWPFYKTTGWGNKQEFMLHPDEMEYSYTFDLPKIEMTGVKFLYVSVDNKDNISLCRHDLREHVDKFTVTFKTRLTPHHWVFWPFYETTGWGDNRQDFPL
jgi:hypothetical protein